MQACARLRVERDRSGASITAEQRDADPLAFRRCVDGAYYLVATAAAPLGRDDISVEIVVGPGAHATVRPIGATVAYASTAARLSTHVVLEEGAALDWNAGTLIATSRCSLAIDAHLELADDASLDFHEELVLGRHGEEPGSLFHRVSAERGGRPVLRHELSVGPGASGWDGPAVLDDARAIAMWLQVGRERLAESLHGEGFARLALKECGELAFALGHDLSEARARLATAERALDPVGI